MPLANERPPLQGVPGMEDAAEYSVGGGAEGDQEVEEQVDGPGSAGRWDVRAGGAGLPLLYGRGKVGAAAGRRRMQPTITATALRDRTRLRGCLYYQNV